jgi:hypothetical protein
VSNSKGISSEGEILLHPDTLSLLEVSIESKVPIINQKLSDRLTAGRRLMAA